MKVKITVDCTPDEARATLGLPDVTSLHDIYLERMRSVMENGVTPDMVSEMVRGWSSMGGAGLTMAQQLFGQLGSGFGGSSSSTAAKDD